MYRVRGVPQQAGRSGAASIGSLSQPTAASQRPTPSQGAAARAAAGATPLFGARAGGDGPAASPCGSQASRQPSLSCAPQQQQHHSQDDAPRHLASMPSQQQWQLNGAGAGFGAAGRGLVRPPGGFGADGW
jgi:hypothetical protein